MDGLTSTSFDRNARYQYLVRLRSEHFGEDPIDILDVGDPYGILQALLPDDNTFSLDLFKEGEPLAERHFHIIGSGFQLPFPDGAFDIVATHDVLEHLPSGTHAQFAVELRRVSRGPVVLVAPFADERTARCEEIANTYYATRTGHTLQPLDEHAEGDGLPTLDTLVGWAITSGIPAVVYSGGWLGHWLTMMMLKAHFAATGDIVSDRSFDTAFNLSLRDRDELAPHYRRAVILDPPRDIAPSRIIESSAETISMETTELTEIAWKVAGTLFPGETPDLPGSRFRSLWDRTATPGSITDELSVSIRRLMDELDQRQTYGTVFADETAPSLAVIVAVLDRDVQEVPGCVKRLLTLVEAYGQAELVVSLQDSEKVRLESVGSPQLRWVDEPADDHILRLNAAVATCTAECLVFIDPRLDVPPDFLHALVRSYKPTQGVTCVAPRGTNGSSAVLGVSDVGEEAFFAPKQAVLVARSSYVGLAGFDGSLLGLFDDLDFGWRLRIIGQKVARADVWCHLPAAAEEVTVRDLSRMRLALYKVFLKNCDGTTLADAIGSELLDSLENPDSEPIDLSPLQRDYALINQQRTHVQSMRKCNDSEIIGQFGVPSLARLEPDQRTGANVRTVAFVGEDQVFRGLIRSISLLRPSSQARVIAASDLRPGRLYEENVRVIVLPAALLGTISAETLSRKVIVDLTEAPPHFGTPSALRGVSGFVCSTSTQNLFWQARLAAILDPDNVPELHVASVAPSAPTDHHFGESGIADIRRYPVVLDCRNNHDSNGLRTLAALLLSSSELGLDSIVTVGSDDAKLLSMRGVRASTDATSSFLQAQVVVRNVKMDDIEAKLASSQSLLHPFVCGTPVVSNMQDPAAEFIIQDGGGFVSHDVAGIVRGVQRILKDPLVQAGTAAGVQRTIATTQHTASKRLNELIDGVMAQF